MLAVTVMVLLPSGILMGWLCVPHQHHPPARAHPYDHRPLLSPCLCCLLHPLCHWHHPLHADLLCGFPACLHLRTHGGECLPLYCSHTVTLFHVFCLLFLNYWEYHLPDYNFFFLFWRLLIYVVALFLRYDFQNFLGLCIWSRKEVHRCLTSPSGYIERTVLSRICLSYVLLFTFRYIILSQYLWRVIQFVSFPHF